MARLSDDVIAEVGESYLGGKDRSDHAINSALSVAGETPGHKAMLFEGRMLGRCLAE